MTHLLIDTSVLIKWFPSEGEAELSEARALRSAHVTGELDAHVLDLAIYEVGNVLARSLRWAASDVADQLDDLDAVVGEPLVMTADWLRQAARLAERHALSFSDASWAATASRIGHAAGQRGSSPARRGPGRVAEPGDDPPPAPIQGVPQRRREAHRRRRVGGREPIVTRTRCSR